MSKRLRREMEDFKNTIEEDIHVVPFENSLFKLNAYIRGPQDTPYENGIYHLEVVISNTYPMVPPVFRFITKVFHPNIYFKDGTICLDILKREWSPAWNIRSACRAILALLADPEASSPLNCDAGNMIRAGDLQAYHSVAKMYNEEFALRKMPR